MQSKDLLNEATCMMNCLLIALCALDWGGRGSGIVEAEVHLGAHERDDAGGVVVPQDDGGGVHGHLHRPPEAGLPSIGVGDLL